MWDGHLESRKNPDRLNRSIHVDRIGVHSTLVYIYAGLRALMIWANCLFSFNTSFFLRKVEDVTTISKSQSLTLVSIKDCTFRVPNETTTLFLLRVIIKAIFIHVRAIIKAIFISFFEFKQFDVLGGKKDKLFADNATHVCEAHDRVMLSFL